ncbi:hypothetical protein STAS_35725, partial [Striga asiatica]
MMILGRYSLRPRRVFGCQSSHLRRTQATTCPQATLFSSPGRFSRFIFSQFLSTQSVSSHLMVQSVSSTPFVQSALSPPFVPFKVPSGLVSHGSVMCALSYLPVFIYQKYTSKYTDSSWSHVDKKCNSGCCLSIHNLIWSASTRDADHRVEFDLTSYTVFRDNLVRWGLPMSYFNHFWVDADCHVSDVTNFQFLHIQFLKHGEELIRDPVPFFVNSNIMYYKALDCLRSDQALQECRK